MKRNHLSIGWLVVSAFLTLQADVLSQSVLVGPGVRNGDFNLDISATDNRTYVYTPYWSQIGTAPGGQNTSATRTNVVYDGTRNYLGIEGANSIGAHDTGHIVAEGDVFNVSYHWYDGGNWDDASDKVEIRLYTTDDDLVSGNATTFATLLSDVNSTGGSYELATGSATGTVSEAGKRLFVAIDSQDGNGNENGYFRIDDFTVTVDPAPNERTSVVDYDPALGNGGFELAVGSTTTNWGTGLNVSVCVTNTGSIVAPHGSSGSALSLNTGYGRGGLQRTGHTVGFGEAFSLSFDWRAGFLWTTSDTIIWRLLTTSDNTVGGTVNVIASGSLSGKSDGANWSTAHVLIDDGAITIDNNGKLLWLEIYAGVQVQDRYALIDMVRLLVRPPQGTVFKFY